MSATESEKMGVMSGATSMGADDYGRAVEQQAKGSDDGGARHQHKEGDMELGGLFEVGQDLLFPFLRDFLECEHGGPP